MVVCRGCYSQIHEIHPIHAFLTVPEKRLQEPASEPNDIDGSGERCKSRKLVGTLTDSLFTALLHDGLKCSQYVAFLYQ
jgi:hypothetical protein